MAADRGAYICQSQSMNIHIQDPNFGKLTSMHFYSWKLGLKTGMYYLRSKAATDAIKFTVDKSKLSEPAAEAEAEAENNDDGEPQPVSAVQEQGQEQEQKVDVSDLQCSLEDPDDCIACGS